MELSESSVIKLCEELNLVYNKGFNNKGWMSISCPVHRNGSLGSSSISKSGVFNCFVCGSTNVFKLLKDQKNLSYSETLNFLNIQVEPELEIKSRRLKTKQIDENIEKEKIFYDIPVREFNPSSFIYTKSRHFTKEFITTFNIGIAKSGYYKDYMIIPIGDSYEARKIKEQEVLDQIGILKKDFKTFIKKENYEYYDNQLYKDNIEIIDWKMSYLLRPKTLYPLNNNTHKETIFNMSQLDINKDLYVCEGTSGLPSIWSHLSKNCTCTFGSNITDKQMKILANFKRIILLVDNDKAGFKMLNALSKLDNVWGIVKTIDDNEEQYIEFIKQAKPMEASRIFLRQNKVFENLIIV